MFGFLRVFFGRVVFTVLAVCLWLVSLNFHCVCSIFGICFGLYSTHDYVTWIYFQNCVHTDLNWDFRVIQALLCENISALP